MIEHETKLIHPDELLKYYGQIVDPLREHDREFLRKVATNLKQDFGGEGWACGESIIRIVNLLSMCELFTQQKATEPNYPDYQSSNQKAIK